VLVKPCSGECCGGSVPELELAIGRAIESSQNGTQSCVLNGAVLAESIRAGFQAYVAEMQAEARTHGLLIHKGKEHLCSRTITLTHGHQLLRGGRVDRNASIKVRLQTERVVP
jgi:hypothetical protein